MIYSEVRKKVYEKGTGLTHKQVKDCLDALWTVVVEGMVADSEVVTPIGKFKKYHIAEKKGRNPSTGEAITIPARNKIRFKLSLNVKKATKLS